MNGSFIDYYPGWFLSLCKRVSRAEFSGRLFNKTFWFQKKKQASADHIFENTIRLSPVPFPAYFLRNEASAFVRMWLNNPPDGRNILPGDWSPSICYDCFHSWHYNPSGTGTQINSQKTYGEMLNLTFRAKGKQVFSNLNFNNYPRFNEILLARFYPSFTFLQLFSKSRYNLAQCSINLEGWNIVNRLRSLIMSNSMVANAIIVWVSAKVLSEMATT